MTRITVKNLRNLCANLNKITGSPAEMFGQREGCGTKPFNVGHYLIDTGYGGYSLSRITTTTGGESNVLSISHIPARELYEQMHAFLRGIELGRELAAATEAA